MKQERNAYDDVIKPDSEPVINVSNGVDFGASGTGHRRTIAGSWRILAILGVLAGLISLFSRDEPESRGETASEDVRKPPAAVTLADTVSRKPKEQDNKRTFRLFSRSVATLEAKDRSGSTISQGSGFLINREGLLVTNLHVIPMSSASVCVTFSDERERIAEGVVAISEEDDLAVLKVPKRLLPMPCRIADTGGDVEVGDSICVIGSPVGLSNSLSEGSVSSFRGDEGNVLQISAPISPGSSGSPVFSSKGEVIAVATASVEGGQNLNFGISIDRLHALLATAEGASAKPLPLEPASVLDAAEIEREFKRTDELVRSGDYAAALVILEQLLEQDSSHAPSWAQIGKVYHALEMPSEAKSAYEQAIQLGSSDPLVFNNLGVERRQEGSLGGAEELFRKSIALDTSTHLLYFRRSPVDR